MAHPKTHRDAWIDAGLDALAEDDEAMVRIEGLARRLGVTKGGFYGYFDSRDQLLTAMLARWESAVTDEVMAQVDAQPAEPRDRLRTLIAIISDPESVSSRLDLELSLRRWATRDARALAAVARVDTARAAYLRAIFGAFCSPEEADARTAIALSVRLAGHIVNFGHGAPTHDGHGAMTHDAVTGLVIDRLLA